MTKTVKLWVGMQKQTKMNKTAIRPKIVNKLLYDQKVLPNGIWFKTVKLWVSCIYEKGWIFLGTWPKNTK